MRWTVCGLLLGILTAACSSPEETAATPTVAYEGPMLEINTSANETSCSEESGCIDNATPIPLDEAPRPLESQTIQGISIGIPQGYTPLELEQEILITAQSADTVGGYTFSIRQITSDTSLQELLERFDQPNFEAGNVIQGKRWQATWLNTADYGAIALLTTDDGQQYFIESFTDQGYWHAFEATFLAMVESLAFS